RAASCKGAGWREPSWPTPACPRRSARWSRHPLLVRKERGDELALSGAALPLETAEQRVIATDQHDVRLLQQHAVHVQREALGEVVFNAHARIERRKVALGQRRVQRRNLVSRARLPNPVETEGMRP